MAIFLSNCYLSSNCLTPVAGAIGHCVGSKAASLQSTILAKGETPNSDNPVWLHNRAAAAPSAN